MPKPQSASSHTALDPVTHMFLAPVLMANFCLAIYITVTGGREHVGLHLWFCILAVALILLNVMTRTYALRVQDRVIRLEERMRLAALLPREEHAVIGTLSTRQLIALRFASDEELPALALRTATENLGSKAIKQAIQNWRPDYARV